MLVEAWLKRAAAPSRSSRVETLAELHLRASSWRRARAGAGQLAALGVAPGERVRDRAGAGSRLRRGPARLHAAAEPSRCRSTCACPCRSARRSPPRARSRYEPLPRPEPAGAGGPAPRGAPHDLDAVAAVIHTSGTTAAPKPVELTYGNLSGARSARPSRWAWIPASAGSVRSRVAHVGGLSILVRSAIYATTAIVHERFETERVLHALQDRRSDARLRWSRPPSRGCSTPACAIRRAALRADRGGPVRPRCSSARAPRGVPVAPTYGLTEACSQVTTLPSGRCTRLAVTQTAGPRARVRRCSARACGSPRTARSCSPGRPSRPGCAGRDGWLHTEISGARRARWPARDRPQGRHDRQRRRERRARRGRGRARGPPGRARGGGRSAARIEQWGEAVTAIVVARPGAPADPRSCARTARAHLAPFKVPKQFVLTRGPLPRTRSGKLLRRELGMSRAGEGLSAASRAIRSRERAPRRSWEEAAPGLDPPARLMREPSRAPVSHWLVEAVSPQPGQRVLELAGGPRRDGAAGRRARRAPGAR